MDLYPAALLPHQIYSSVLPDTEVLNYCFVRETQEDIYSFLDKGFSFDDIIEKIIAPPTSKRDVFELSVYLYGYYNEKHFGIKPTDTSLNADWNNKIPVVSSVDIEYTQEMAFSLFLSVVKLYEQAVDFSGEKYIFSFSHKPTMANYWHFQLFTKDNAGNIIPRNKSNARSKHLAKYVLENIMLKAMCQTTDVKPFRRDDFDKVLEASPTV